jgi:hypothetical protein
MEDIEPEESRHIMRSYKGPSYQDRVGRAAVAKQAALDRLKARPPVDEAALAERRAAGLARAEDEKQARAAKRAAADRAAAAAPVPEPEPATEAELKAARDARYAARKSRK